MCVGVYKIQNTVSGKYYIGSSKNVFNRMRQHFSALRNNRHHCIGLQNSFNQHGFDAFAFCLLSICYSIDDAHKQEEILLGVHYGTKYCLNSSPLVELPFHHKHVRERARQTALKSEKYKTSHREVCLKRNSDPTFKARLVAGIRASKKHKEATSKNASTVLQRPDVIAKNREILRNSERQKEAARKQAALLNTPEMRKKNLEATSCKVVGTSLTTGKSVFFDSQSEAARWVGCYSSNISMCCKGDIASVKGYKWKKRP